MNGDHRSVYPLVGGAVLGFVGLVVGYFSPNGPGSSGTAGPLTAMFVTAPLGAAVGLVAGLILAVRRVSGGRFVIIVGCLAVPVTALSLVLSLPEDQFEAEMVEGEIIRCRAAATLVPAATARWVAMPPLRPRWNEDIQRMLDADRGVVLTLHVSRTKSLYKSRKPWSSGRLVTNGWRVANRTEDYFAAFDGTDCGAYRRGADGIYSLEWIESQVSPPDVLPSFLGLRVLRPARVTLH